MDLPDDTRMQIFPERRGNIVLGIYHALANLPMGVIAKINIREIRFPYSLDGGAIGLLEARGNVIVGFVLARGHNATRQHLPEDQGKILAVVAGGAREL